MFIVTFGNGHGLATCHELNIKKLKQTDHWPNVETKKKLVTIAIMAIPPIVFFEGDLVPQ